MKKTLLKTTLPVLFALVATTVLPTAPLRADQEILNASYDIGRELFAEVNKSFTPYWKAKTGDAVNVKQSHAGSSRQARSILEGLAADVVTFNTFTDVQLLADRNFVDKSWTEKLPHKASPYYSVHSILVRKGNPKGIKDWSDLTKPGVGIVQVNPKTGGNGRYAALAYYAYGLETGNGDAAQAREFLKKVLANVVVFESGGRAATTTFTERGIGDALVTFEAETLAYAAGPDSPYEVVTPSVSVLSEFPVAVVEKVARKRKTEALARGYLEYLYTEEGQEIIARNFYRPRDTAVAKRHESVLKPVKVVEVDDVFGGWSKATKDFFDNGALIDTLLREVAEARR